MEDLKEKRELLEAIRKAVASINLEEDFNIDLSDENIEEIKDKILKLGGNDEKLGGLFNRRN